MRSKQFLVVVEEEALAFTRPEAVELFESCGLTREQAHIALDHSMDAPERCTTAPSSAAVETAGHRSTRQPGVSVILLRPKSCRLKQLQHNP